MLPGQYDTFRYSLQGKFGRNPYFECRKSSRLCTPREVEVVRSVQKELGLEHLEFDGYVKRINWTD